MLSFVVLTVVGQAINEAEPDFEKGPQFVCTDAQRFPTGPHKQAGVRRV